MVMFVMPFVFVVVVKESVIAVEFGEAIGGQRRIRCTITEHILVDADYVVRVPVDHIQIV